MPSPERLKSRSGLARAAQLTPLGALDELAARLIECSMPPEPAYRPVKPQLLTLENSRLYDDRPMIFSPAHARRAMAPTARGPARLKVAMTKTVPAGIEALGLLAKPTHSSFTRAVETQSMTQSRSHSSLTSSIHRERSLVGSAGGLATSASSISLRSPIYTPNRAYSRSGVPPSPHHGMASRVRAEHSEMLPREFDMLPQRSL